MSRPSWDDIWMEMAFVFRKRSPDPDTKHGAVVVSENKRKCSFGYNGYPRNCVHEKMPKTRPDKYLVTRHAEQNAISNADFCLDGATLYVTGKPCHQCWNEIVHSGIARVVHGHVNSHCIDERSEWASKLILEDQNIIIEEYQFPREEDDSCET